MLFSPRTAFPTRTLVAALLSLSLGVGLSLATAGGAVAFPLPTVIVDNVIYKATSGAEVSVVGFSSGAIPTTLTIASAVTLSPGGLRNVTNIANSAFTDHTTLTSVVLPNTITSIGIGAFDGATHLSSVTFLGGPPATFTAAGLSGSLGTASGLKVHFGQSFRASVFSGGFTTPTWQGYDAEAIPFTVSFDPNTGTGAPSVGSQEYFGDTALTLPTVGAMEKAGYGFEGWSTSAGDANGVGATVIDGAYAPAGNLTLYAVWKLIPLPITATINDVTYVQTTGTSTTVSVTGNTITTPTDLVIPETVEIEGDTYGVTAIEGAAFIGNSTLMSVVIPNTVTRIGGQAFQSTPALTSVTIGSGVTDIGGFAFYSTGLTTLTLGSSVTSLGDYAFSENSALASVTFNEGLTSMGEGAFFRDAALTEVVLPDSLTRLGEWAFAENPSLASVTIGSGVTVVSNAAFQNATSLKTVNFGPSVTTVGHWTFDGATALRHVVIPATVTFIGQGAFGNNDHLTSVTFQGAPPLASGDYLQHPGFWGADSSTPSFGSGVALSVFFSSSFAAPGYSGGFTSPLWQGYTSFTPTIIDGIIYRTLSATEAEAVGNTFTGEAGATDLVIPSAVTIGGRPHSVTSIANNAFSAEWVTDEDAFFLGSAVIPNSVTSIGSSAFSNNQRMTSVTLGTGVTSIGDFAFYRNQSLTNITIPDAVETIGNSAFAASESLVTVSMGNAVTAIGDNAFASNTNLTSITLSTSLETIGVRAFQENPALVSIVIPDSVTAMGEYAFAANTSLATLVIGDGLTSVSEGAFQGSDALTSVTLGDSVEIIEYGAFQETPALASILIPASVVRIDADAFAGDTALVKVTFVGAPPTIITPAGEGASLGHAEGLTVYFSTTYASPLLADGFTAPLWQGYSSKVVAVTPVTPVPPAPTPEPTSTPSFTVISAPEPPRVELVLNFVPGAVASESTTTITAAGLRAGSSFTVVMRSTPTTLYTGVVDSAGVASAVVRLPAGIPAGSHSLTFSGTAEDGSRVESVAWFALDASGVVTAVSALAAIPEAAVVPEEIAATASETAVVIRNGSESNLTPLLYGGGAILLVAAGLAWALVAQRRRRAQANA